MISSYTARQITVPVVNECRKRIMHTGASYKDFSGYGAENRVAWGGHIWERDTWGGNTPSLIVPSSMERPGVWGV